MLKYLTLLLVYLSCPQKQLRLMELMLKMFDFYDTSEYNYLIQAIWSALFEKNVVTLVAVIKAMFCNWGFIKSTNVFLQF